MNVLRFPFILPQSPRHWRFLALSLLVLQLSLPNEIKAEFSKSNRSINGTGEVLGDGEIEIGFGSASYGYSDQIMFGIPTGHFLTGQGKFEAKYKLDLGASMRLTPAVAIGPAIFPDLAKSIGFEHMDVNPYVMASFDFGVNIGGQDEHSITVGLDLKSVKRRATGGEIKRKILGDVRFEYDFYHRGNVAYFGLFRQAPYVGYTWGFESTYIGLISSVSTSFYPFPYIYWRF